MVANVVELAVGTEVNALEVVGQGHAGIETDAQSAVVGLLACLALKNVVFDSTFFRARHSTSGY